MYQWERRKRDHSHFHLIAPFQACSLSITYLSINKLRVYTSIYINCRFHKRKAMHFLCCCVFFERGTWQTVANIMIGQKQQRQALSTPLKIKLSLIRLCKEVFLQADYPLNLSKGRPTSRVSPFCGGRFLVGHRVSHIRTDLFLKRNYINSLTPILIKLQSFKQATRP